MNVPLAMVDVELFEPLVLPLVDQCPADVAMLQLTLAAQRFCERTWFVGWQWAGELAAGGLLDAFELGALDDWDADDAQALQFIDVRFLAVNGRAMARRTPREMERVAHLAGTPLYYAALGAGRARVLPAPVESLPVAVEWIVAPRADALRVPAVLFERWGQALAYAAAAALLMMPGKPWSAPRFAADYLSLYNQAEGQAISEIGALGLGSYGASGVVPLRTFGV